jgi:hypothetical protein
MSGQYRIVQTARPVRLASCPIVSSRFVAVSRTMTAGKSGPGFGMSQRSRYRS